MSALAAIWTDMPPAARFVCAAVLILALAVVYGGVLGLLETVLGGRASRVLTRAGITNDALFHHDEVAAVKRLAAQARAKEEAMTAIQRDLLDRRMAERIAKVSRGY